MSIYINDQQKQLIENNVVAVATVDEGNKPHCIAIAAVKVISPNQVIMTNNYMNQTPKNIQCNNTVAFVVWNKDWENDCIGYEFIGSAEYFCNGNWLNEVKKMKDNEGLPAQGAIVVTIQKIKQLA